MLAALAFVPLHDVVKAFEELVDYLPESILPVVDYFEDNFIGRLYIYYKYIYIMYNILLIFENFNFKGRSMRRTRQTPKLQPKLWNLYEAAIHRRRTSSYQ